MDDWSKTQVHEPGNGSRYVVAWGVTDGEQWVAVPNLHTAAMMTHHPVEEGYVMAKLGLSKPDSLAILGLLNSPGPAAAMYAVSILVNGETLWQTGYWKTADEATAWMDRNDAAIESLVVDFSREHHEGDRNDAMGTPEIDVIVVLVNNKDELARAGWAA